MADAAPQQITLTFPDGATRKVESGTTGFSVAKAISPSLAKRTVAMSLDGKLADLADPKTQVTIGPVIENGFYYDFAKQEPFHPDDLAKIEKKMGEIIAKNAPFTKEFWSRKKTKEFFKERGENFKVELVDAIPEGEDLKIYKQGEWLDLCRGPHMTSTGAVGKAWGGADISRPMTGWAPMPTRASSIPGCSRMAACTTCCMPMAVSPRPRRRGRART